MAETEKGELVRMDFDHSQEVASVIPKAKAEKDLNKALESLLTIEKKARASADTHSLSKILVAVVQILAQAKSWSLLNEQVLTLSRHRRQMKQAIGYMVKECMSVLDTIKDTGTEVQLIEALREVSAGKMYLETERALLTHRLALIKEQSNDLESAANLMLELQVETYGSMDPFQKVDLILEQMRLSLLRNDFIRAQIISKKINTRIFADNSESYERKLIYYGYMIQLSIHEKAYLDAFKHHFAIYEIPGRNKADGIQHLKSAILFLLMSPRDPEQHDLMLKVSQLSDLESLKTYKELLRLHTNPELIRWKVICEAFEKELRGDKSGPLADETNWQVFGKRVIEHNLRVVAKYYTRITLKRMGQLLDLPAKQAEQALADLVSGGNVHAKIDRPLGVVYFSQGDKPVDLLDSWSQDIGELASILETTTHLVNKELMVHKYMFQGKKVGAFLK